MSPRSHRRVHVAVLGIALAGIPVHAQDDFDPPPLASLPIAEWLMEDETEQIDWDLDVGDVELRMDQRLALEFQATVRAGGLEPEGVRHELTMWSWLTDGDGRLLAYSGPLPESVEEDAPSEVEIDFKMQLLVTPGDYRLSVILYDQTAGLYNLHRERFEVDGIDDDALAEVFRDVPVAVFSEIDPPGEALAENSPGDLFIPIRSTRPLEIDLVGILSLPEQRSSQQSVRRHTDNVGGALRALSQLDPERGAVSVHGLDLIRRELVFDEADIWKLDAAALMDAFETANPPSISLDALTGRDRNPAFFRRYIEDLVAGRFAEGTEALRREVPLKVLIVVAGFSLFADDADRSRVAFEGRCDCRVYHIRIRQNINDVFDDINGILDPLSPRTFNLLTPGDLRRAIVRIVEDLERF